MKNYIRFCTILFVSTVFLHSGCGQAADAEHPQSSGESVPGTSSAALTFKTDKSNISGQWARTDAPYQLRISDFKENGTLKAAYFNPKEIHVGKSSWAEVKGTISIYVELQDVNYPGSNYTLYYVPGQDLLSGKYFQAVEGATYDISFTRVK